ncbi:MAG TPA: glycoside hydrolase family 28 protein, partial [Bacteroidales bacterium]|nr:glycoside hydrolase family 28 protein [Bacteroidales bacterium]
MRKRSIYLIFTVIVTGVLLYAFQLNTGRTDGWSDMERILGRISEPQFSKAGFDITDYGATEGAKNNARAIRKAIEACSAGGGGRVVVPAGEFHTGSVHLKSNVNLHLSKGARLVFSTDPEDYLPLVITRWEGMDCYNYSPLVYANNCENVAITGEGILDGQADSSNWWTWKGRREYGWKAGMNSQLNPKGRPLLQQYEREQVPVEKRIMGPGAFLRPQFINFYKCRNILVEDVTIMNAPFWLIHPVFSENIIVRNVKADSHGPNNDGFDPESSRNILVENCRFNTGDDCIAIKSGRNNDGRRANIPGENI